MNKVYIIMDTISLNPVVFSNYQAAKDHFLWCLECRAKTLFGANSLPIFVHHSLVELKNKIDGYMNEFGKVIYELPCEEEGKEYILYAREVDFLDKI